MRDTRSAHAKHHSQLLARTAPVLRRFRRSSSSKPARFHRPQARAGRLRAAPSSSPSPSPTGPSAQRPTVATRAETQLASSLSFRLPSKASVAPPHRQAPRLIPFLLAGTRRSTSLIESASTARGSTCPRATLVSSRRAVRPSSSSASPGSPHQPSMTQSCKAWGRRRQRRLLRRHHPLSPLSPLAWHPRRHLHLPAPSPLGCLLGRRHLRTLPVHHQACSPASSSASACASQ